MNKAAAGKRPNVAQDPSVISHKALELISKAIAADNSKDYRLAFQLYQNGIALLLDEIKHIKPGPTLDTLKGKVDSYMTRAEELSTIVVMPVSTTTPPKPTKRVPKDSDKYCHMILDEVLDSSPCIKWDDIAGLAVAKQVLQEAVILPSLRPDIFTGLRAPPSGVLLFGPPGTGKTLLAKAVASESNARFFSISASSLTSKWVGDGEKLVRALFEMARELSPSVVFIDEIDSLLSKRSAEEHDASRRIKNQFMVELDGVSTIDNRVLVMGATNLPFELDEAVIRRLEKRVYVPLPDATARKYLVSHLLSSEKSNLSPSNINKIVKVTDGYSGSDLKSLVKEAVLGPIREIKRHDLKSIKESDIRSVSFEDFKNAVGRVRSSINPASLLKLEEWNSQYGADS